MRMLTLIVVHTPRAHPLNSLRSFFALLLAYSMHTVSLSAQVNVLPPSSPFVLAFDTKRTIGTLATSEQMCELLQHPFFSHDSNLFRFVDWDPRNLSPKWIREYLTSVQSKNLWVSKSTQEETDSNLRACLQQLSATNKKSLNGAERLLNLRTSCVLPTRQIDEHLTSSSQVAKTEGLLTVRCANWGAVWEQPFPKEIAFLLMLTIREANAALRSILDTGEAAWVTFEANRSEFRRKGEEYASSNETKWSSKTVKDPLSDTSVTTSSSMQENSNGAAAQIRIQCVDGRIKFRALVVGKDGNPTVRLSETTGLFGQPAIKGRIRINDDQPNDEYFGQLDFRNEIDLGIDSETVLAGLYWRVYAAVPTSAGDLLLKVPLFDSQVRKTIDGCRK